MHALFYHMRLFLVMCNKTESWMKQGLILIFEIGIIGCTQTSVYINIQVHGRRHRLRWGSI